MGRRRKEDNLIVDLINAPWQTSAILAFVSFVALNYVVPLILSNSSGLVYRGFAAGSPSLAKLAVTVFIFTGIFSAIASRLRKKKEKELDKHKNEQEEQEQRRRKELFERQQNLPDINSLTWREFETFIGEAYRRQGYQVEDKGGSAPDGGIDLILRKDNEIVIVQCKHWKAWQVGVDIVRELYGVVAAQGATKGILVTTGLFTNEAENWAHGKPLLLIRGNELSRLVEEGQKPLESESQKPVQKICSQCGKNMRLRVRQAGESKGKQFWVCAAYPDCKNVISA
jgi:restriction system protein